jgi:hypothetical protein
MLVYKNYKDYGIEYGYGNTTVIDPYGHETMWFNNMPESEGETKAKEWIDKQTKP